MKLLIAGSRSITDYEVLEHVINRLPELDVSKIDCVISGTAAGVDTLGEVWAANNRIPVIRYPADWKQYGKAAGPIRNKQMADVCDSYLILWDGVSHGATNMLTHVGRSAYSPTMVGRVGGKQLHVYYGEVQK